MKDNLRVFFIDPNPKNSKAIALALNSVGVEVDSCSSYKNASRTIVKNASRFSMIFFGMNSDFDSAHNEEIDVVRLSISMLIPYLTFFQRDSDYVKFSSFSNIWEDKSDFIDNSISFNLKGKTFDSSLWYKIWDYILIGFNVDYSNERCINSQRSFLPEEWDNMMENKRKINSSPFNIGFIAHMHNLRKLYKESFGRELNCHKENKIF